jgi:hypothetical protein
MSISEAVIAVKGIDFNGFSLHYLCLCNLCEGVGTNLCLVQTKNPEARDIERISIAREKVLDLINQAAAAINAREEMQKFYKDIIKEFEPLK